MGSRAAMRGAVPYLHCAHVEVTIAPIYLQEGDIMQGGQQFKIDQPGLMKAGPIALIVAAVCGLAWIIIGLWGIAGLLGYLAPIFAGVWYVMTVRKSGAMPAQMDGLVNGAILGAVAGLAYGIVAL